MATTPLENFTQNLSHAWSSCVTTVENTAQTISEAYEDGRKHISALSQKNLPKNISYIVDRIMLAVPEVFIALSALAGGLLTVPALLLSLGRTGIHFWPLLKSACKGELDPDKIGNRVVGGLKGLGEMFETNLVPALLVAFTVDSIFSLALGFFAHNWSRMVHFSAIALPGVYLSLQYLRHQMEQELPVPALTDSTMSS